MDFAQLKGSLKTSISPVYLCYGTDYFLLNKVPQLVRNAMPQAEVTKFDATTPPENVIASLSTTTFFATARIVIYDITDKTSVTALNQYLKQPAADSVLILIYANEKPFNNLKQATLVNCNPMPAEILMPLIAKQIAPHQITRDAANYLIEATGGDYSLIDNELNKFLSFYADVPTFELKHLQPYLTKTLDYQIYELGAAILRHDVAAAEPMLQYLLAGNSEYAIFGGVVSQLRRAYYATATKGDINVVGKILGCSPYAIKYSRRDYGNQSAAARNCYARSLDLEYQIKSGQITAASALAALIYR